MGAPRFRVMTYNVHRCIGRGGRDSTSDVAALCRESAPDIVALQEVDGPGEGDDLGERGRLVLREKCARRLALLNDDLLQARLGGCAEQVEPSDGAARHDQP